MALVRVAQAQMNPTLGDFSGNIEKMVRFIHSAKSQGAEVITFPELALCGYPPEDLLFKPSFLTRNREALERLVPSCKGITAVVGFPEASAQPACAYNSAALIHNGRLAGVYRKVELPNYGVFDEKRYFLSGSEFLVWELGGARFSISVCEDIWIPGSLVERFAAENTVHVVLNISSSPFHAGKLNRRKEIVTRFAKAAHAAVCYNNLVGGQDELVFDGGSLVMDPEGTLIGEAKRFEEDLLVTDVEFSESPRQLPADLRGTFLKLRPVRSHAAERVPPRIEREPAPLEEIYRALVIGTRDYVRKNGFTQVVLGLSGGIDSALTAAIALDALGPQDVVGVTMPSAFTSGETRSDAERLAWNLGIRLITVPIGGILDAYMGVLSESFGEGPPGVAHENLQARIRGNILMALSNRFGWLVLTTGNKSETAVGYCTLYGDMAGGFAVIKDVLKTVVYQLAKYVNEKAGRELIPWGSITRPPSAELRPDQKDEDSLPPYAVLDPILQAYVELDRSIPQIAELGFDEQVVTDVVRMVDGSEYKRRQAPPGVKITPRAFGKDRRLPVTNRHKG
ncbi:MAG: NAD+ synthase [Thermodesulfobacteriota bacterium]